MINKNCRGGGGISHNTPNTNASDGENLPSANNLEQTQQTRFAWSKNNIPLSMVFTLIMVVALLVVSMTYGLLSDSKTATGVISIELPPTVGTTSGQLYYDRLESKMYLGADSNGILVSTNSTHMGKIVLADTKSAGSAYIKIEISLLGDSTALTLNSNAITFSDNTAMASSIENGVITLTSNRAVLQYSHIFLDEVLSNININGSTADIQNGTLQVSVQSSLNDTFTNVGTSTMYYDISSPSLAVTVQLPTGEGYTATAVTTNPIIGSPYEFTVTLQSGYNNTPPTVQVNGEPLEYDSVSGDTYTYVVSYLTENIHITIVAIYGADSTVDVTITGDVAGIIDYGTTNILVGSYIIWTSNAISYKTSIDGDETVLCYTITTYGRNMYKIIRATINGNEMVQDQNYKITENSTLYLYWENLGSGSGSR